MDFKLLNKTTVCMEISTKVEYVEFGFRKVNGNE